MTQTGTSNNVEVSYYQKQQQRKTKVINTKQQRQTDMNHPNRNLEMLPAALDASALPATHEQLRLAQAKARTPNRASTYPNLTPAAPVPSRIPASPTEDIRPIRQPRQSPHPSPGSRLRLVSCSISYESNQEQPSVDALTPGHLTAY